MGSLEKFGFLFFLIFFTIFCFLPFIMESNALFFKYFLYVIFSILFSMLFKTKKVIFFIIFSVF